MSRNLATQTAAQLVRRRRRKAKTLNGRRTITQHKQIPKSGDTRSNEVRQACLRHRDKEGEGYTHTHTHTQREREREFKLTRYKRFTSSHNSHIFHNELDLIIMVSTSFYLWPGGEKSPKWGKSVPLFTARITRL